MLGETVSPLPEEGPKKLYLRISSGREHLVDKISTVLSAHPGELPVYLYYEAEKITKMAPNALWVTTNQKLLEQLSELLDAESVRLV